MRYSRCWTAVLFSPIFWSTRDFCTTMIEPLVPDMLPGSFVTCCTCSTACLENSAYPRIWDGVCCFVKRSNGLTLRHIFSFV
jgi:hypothetical protein